MNIFILDESPELCARYHVNKHVVKMILETAQLMSTAVRVSLIEESNKKLTTMPELGIYKTTHTKHPCSLWTKESLDNFLWLAELGKALGKEYTFRYGKEHRSIEVIKRCVGLKHVITKGKITKFAQAMPDKYKCENAVNAYRAYYIGDKAKIAEWKNRPEPEWWKTSGERLQIKEPANGKSEQKRSFTSVA